MLLESPATAAGRIGSRPASFKGAEQSARVRASGRTSSMVRPRSKGLHGLSPRKCQRISTLRWGRLPPSRPPTQERGPRRRRRIQRQSHVID